MNIARTALLPVAALAAALTATAPAQGRMLQPPKPATSDLFQPVHHMGNVMTATATPTGFTITGARGNQITIDRTANGYTVSGGDPRAFDLTEVAPNVLSMARRGTYGGNQLSIMPLGNSYFVTEQNIAASPGPLTVERQGKELIISGMFDGANYAHGLRVKFEENVPDTQDVLAIVAAVLPRVMP